MKAKLTGATLLSVSPRAGTLVLSLVLLALLVLSSACSTWTTTEDLSRAQEQAAALANKEAKLADEREEPYVVEVVFRKKSAKLPPDARAKVEALYRKVRRPERLMAVKIISWADEESPSRHRKQRTFLQIGLAKRRGEALVALLKGQNDKLEFDVYNMAKRPEKFSEFIRLADASVKKSFERAGVATTDDVEIGKTNSKARRAIVMLMTSELPDPTK